MVSEPRSFDSGQALRQKFHGYQPKQPQNTPAPPKPESSAGDRPAKPPDWIQQGFNTLDTQYQTLVHALNNLANSMAYPHYPFSPHSQTPIWYPNPHLQNLNFINPTFTFPNPQFPNPTFTFPQVFSTSHPIHPTQTSPHQPYPFSPQNSYQASNFSTPPKSLSKKKVEDSPAPVASESTEEEAESEEEIAPAEEPATAEAETDKQVFEEVIAMEEPTAVAVETKDVTVEVEPEVEAPAVEEPIKEDEAPPKANAVAAPSEKKAAPTAKLKSASKAAPVKEDVVGSGKFLVNYGDKFGYKPGICNLGIEGYFQIFNHSERKKMPDICNCFEWCASDSFYTNVTTNGLKQGLQSFEQGGITPKFVIFNDGGKRGAKVKSWVDEHYRKKKYHPEIQPWDKVDSKRGYVTTLVKQKVVERERRRVY